jgi:molecular chaperone DnaK
MRIVNYLADEFKKGAWRRPDLDKMALQRLKEAAEKAKIELSSASRPKSTSRSSAWTCTRAAAAPGDEADPRQAGKPGRGPDQEVDEALRRRAEGCRRPKDDIDEVVLVGGMTRMPRVIEEVTKFFGKEPHKGVNPDEVVALGRRHPGRRAAGRRQGRGAARRDAAVAGHRDAGRRLHPPDRPQHHDPDQEVQVFSTAEDNQNAVTIRVFQGEREMAADNKMLGQFNLEQIPPAPRGVPQIEVTFDIDANGIVSVSAKDKGTGKEQQITIQASGGLSDDDIEKMVKDAEANAEADKKRRELVETEALSTRAKACSIRPRSRLSEHGDKVDGGGRVSGGRWAGAAGDDEDVVDAEFSEVDEEQGLICPPCELQRTAGDRGFIVKGCAVMLTGGRGPLALMTVRAREFMTEIDYYELLEVERTADDKTIKSSYRRLAMQFHPDKQSRRAEAESVQGDQRSLRLPEGPAEARGL